MQRSKEIEVCKSLIFHEDAVNRAKQSMPTEDLVRKIGDFFKVLGDPTRIKIVNALFESELCVCDLTAVLGMNQPAVSHQLKILKQSGLVTYRKEGKIVYYSLNDDHVKVLYEQGKAHIQEEKGDGK